MSWFQKKHLELELALTNDWIKNVTTVFELTHFDPIGTQLELARLEKERSEYTELLSLCDCNEPSLEERELVDRLNDSLLTIRPGDSLWIRSFHEFTLETIIKHTPSIHCEREGHVFYRNKKTRYYPYSLSNHIDLEYHPFLPVVLQFSNGNILKGTELTNLYQSALDPVQESRVLLSQKHRLEVKNVLTRIWSGSPLFDPDVIVYVLEGYLDDILESKYRFSLH
jgi:hypothetical protein